MPRAIKSIGIICVAITLSIPVPAYSDTLLEQTWLGCFCGLTSISGVNEQSVAEDFTPTGNWQISEVRWTGLFRNTITVQATRNFIIDFYVDAGGVPAEFPFVSIPVVANSSFNASVFDLDGYDFSAVFGLAVAQGTTFWISITDDGPDKSGSNGMFWGRSGDAGFVFRFGDSGAWRNLSGGVSFTLIGTENLDTDDDGVPDDEDNCPTTFNSGQEQTGNNVGGDFGDACVSPDVTIPGNATVEPGAVIEPGVELNTGVTVMAGAQVGANATLNKNSTVEANAIISENAVLNQGSTVGEGAIIGMNVILNQGAMVDAGAKVGDNTVVGKNAHIFANAVVGCFAAPTSFTPVCPGAALGAELEKIVQVQAGAVVADGTVIPKDTTVTP